MIFTTRFAWLMALGLAAMLTGLAGTAEAQSATGDFVSVEGGRLWYQTCGAGPKAMVLIHDGILHSATWDEVWPILCRDFHVVRYDQRGFGRSPAATAPYSPVDDLAAVMQAAGLDHAVLVGSSSGGGLAVDFTLQHPAEVDRLVLAGPAVSGLRFSQYFNERGAALSRKMDQGDIDGALKDSWAFAPGHDAARKEAVALLTANPQDMTHADPARRAPVARPLLPSIKTPTLILVGEYDIADNQGQAGALEALIPGSRRVVVRDAGHLMYLEHPDVFAQMVTQFANAGATPASPQSPGAHNEIAMDAAAKQSFVGQYQLAAKIILTITLEGDQLYAQATGQARAAIFPEDPAQFFYKVVYAQLNFDIGPDGRPASVTLHQNGRALTAKRIN